ncbi:Cyclin-T1-3 [Ranunculus cassubicifolius]
MAGLSAGNVAHHGVDGGSDRFCQKKEEGISHWYLSRKDIEENSPSRKDGIDLKKETSLRKSYCTFLQDLGMRLKVPQVTIATAIIFCHRFFLHQSHAKNDLKTVATVCMFLAGKVEETPRPLKDVILVSYEIIHKKDPTAAQKIKQKEVYEEQKELILYGERLVLTTLGFDLNILHPYKPLVEAIKRFQVAQNSLAQVAWNFVNDGLRTSLCLQFKSHHIAAGAIFLAAKFLKVKLPSEGEKVWWKEFDVTSRQLEEVSNQMLELYEQNRKPAKDVTASKEEGVAGGPHSGKSRSHGSTESKSDITEHEDSQALEKKIDKEKFKAAMEKRKKARSGDSAVQKKEVIDDDDLIERELEDGVELAVKQVSKENDVQEDGEVEEFESPKSSATRKRKAETPEPENDNETGHVERDHKRHVEESHIEAV